MANLFEHSEHLQAQALDPGGPVHVRAFAAWVLGKSDVLRELVTIATASGQQRHPEHVAVLGYAEAAGILAEDTTGLLRDDLAQLGGRSYFATGRHLKFEIDGVALLGVALGFGDRQAEAAWLVDLLNRASNVSGDPWNVALIDAARLALHASDKKIPVPELAVALSARGLGGLPDDLDAAWKAAMSISRPETADRAAARLGAMQDLSARSAHIVPRAATRDDLVTVLRGTAHSLKRWPYGERTPQSKFAKWEVESEYNVQDFLWAVLAPVFPDLEDEESLPSIGPKHSRADLCVPKLRTIIEVKYMRTATQSERAKVVEEVAADAGLYLSRTRDYDDIVAYIWDDASQTEYHEEIRSGLSKLPGIREVVIVPRPGKMARTEPRKKAVRSNSKNGDSTSDR